MTNAKLRRRSCLGSLLFVAAASAGIALGACKDEDESEPLEVSAELESACVGYCENLAKCNEETVEDECVEKCKGVLYACEEHEEGEALDQVNQCAGEDCLALPACTLNAGVQCVTGLGL